CFFLGGGGSPRTTPPLPPPPLLPPGRTGDRGAVRLVMTEGRKREVRRLLAAVGLPVTRLVRVRVGAVRLGALAPGERRELSHDEVVALRHVVDG
ncbi:MAG: hypothetical protein ACR2L4_05290, partial [Actinomycetota bacterium]